jgi:hypothetical protein
MASGDYNAHGCSDYLLKGWLEYFLRLPEKSEVINFKDWVKKNKKEGRLQNRIFVPMRKVS